MNQLVLPFTGALFAIAASVMGCSSDNGTALPGSSGGAGTGGTSVGGAAPTATGGSAGNGASSGGSENGSGGGSSGGASFGTGGGNSGGANGSGGQASSGGAASGGSGGSTPIVRPELVTSGPNAYWQEGTLTDSTGAATVTVNEAAPLQTWLGFGGTFNEKGWEALLTLPETERLRAIELLFSASEGARFDWGRIPMGASDYALDGYTLNETANDLAMDNFSIERDRGHLIPYIKAALAVKSDIRFWASPWTPPSWMKSSGTIEGSDLLPDSSNQATAFEASMLDDPAILEAYALYFARFIEEYEKEGIHIEHVEPQNEPGYATRYPSCIWPAGLLGKFVGDYLAPTLASRNLDTEIWFGTLSNADTYQGHIGGLTGAAKDAVTGVGLQWNTVGEVKNLSDQGFLVLQTEHRCGNFPWETDNWNPNQPGNDHAYALRSWGWIAEWLTAGVHSYSAWNMVLDTEGKNLDPVRPWPQNALLVVDRDAGSLTVTPTYHLFRHFSYYVEPGAVRLTVEANGVDAFAFKNPDGRIVAIVSNAGAQPTQSVLSLGGRTVQVELPAQGWASVQVEGT